jgi:hypothetical protein
MEQEKELENLLEDLGNLGFEAKIDPFYYTFTILEGLARTKVLIKKVVTKALIQVSALNRKRKLTSVLIIYDYGKREVAGSIVFFGKYPEEGGYECNEYSEEFENWINASIIDEPAKVDEPAYFYSRANVLELWATCHEIIDESCPQI